MSLTKAILAVAACGAAFAAAGAVVGCAIGFFAPGYYRAMFPAGREPWFDPIAVGLGQGLTQGLAAGLLVGTALAAIHAWRDSRRGRV